MDFTFTEEQDAVAAVAHQLFTGRAGVERVREIESTDEGVDRALWADLAAANLLGLVLPPEHGGSGLGMTELALVLEEQGRRVAPVPLVWTMVAALTIAEFGTPEQRAALLTPVVAGEAFLAIALAEPGAGDPLDPSVTATQVDGRWVLDGVKVDVPAAHVASAILVPARADDGLIVALVDGAVVSGERARSTANEVLTHVTLSRTPAAVVAGPEDAERAVRWAFDRALVGLAALQLGVAEEALAQAASYTSGRIQFGKPLAGFQSAAARAADAYIDCEAMRTTLWQAAWRLDLGLDASTEVAVAAWWAKEAGQRVVHAVQHLHGGMGADVEYPVHRYFLWGKQIEDTLGGGSAHLARIGKALACP